MYEVNVYFSGTFPSIVAAMEAITNVTATPAYPGFSPHDFNLHHVVIDLRNCSPESCELDAVYLGNLAARRGGRRVGVEKCRIPLNGGAGLA